MASRNDSKVDLLYSGYRNNGEGAKEAVSTELKAEPDKGWSKETKQRTDFRTTTTKCLLWPAPKSYSVPTCLAFQKHRENICGMAMEWALKRHQLRFVNPLQIPGSTHIAPVPVAGSTDWRWERPRESVGVKRIEQGRDRCRWNSLGGSELSPERTLIKGLVIT